MRTRTANTRTRINVYDSMRRTIIATCCNKSTSAGAVAAANRNGWNAEHCTMVRVNGGYVWVADVAVNA